MDSQFQDEFWTCPFLVDPENELNKHDQISQKNLRVITIKFELYHEKLVELVDYVTLEKRHAELATNIGRLKIERDIFESKASKVKENNNALHEDIIKLRLGVQEKHNNLVNSAEHLDNLKTRADDVHKDQEKIQEQIKTEFESICFMKREYKKSLGCQIHISSSDDSGDIYFFTFANALKKNDRTTVPLNSVKIYINKEKFIKLLDSNPSLPNLSRIAAMFEESQDTQGLLAYLKNMWE